MLQPKTRKEYRAAVWARAREETKARIGDPKHRIRVAVSLMPTGILLIVAVRGWTGLWDAAVAALLTAAATLIVVVTPLLWQRIRAPFLIYREDHLRIDQLHQEVQTRSRNQALAEALGERDEWAVHNLWVGHPRVRGTPEYDNWLVQHKAWRTTVLEILKEHNCGYLDVKHFRVVGDLRVEPSGIENDPLVDHQLRMFLIRQKRLRDLISKYRTD